MEILSLLIGRKAVDCIIMKEDHCFEHVYRGPVGIYKPRAFLVLER